MVMHRKRPTRLGLGCCLLIAAALSGLPARAQGTHTQTFELHPGWNAIHLEVAPEPSAIGDAFAGIPVASVWTYDARFGGKVTGVVDPARGLLESTGWYGYFPPSRPESALTNLFHLRANRAYLVKLDGTMSVQWSVTGLPALQPLKWEPDSFNLVGLPVDPQNPPSFGSWFEPSPAHRGQAVFRLDPAGTWQPVIPYFEPIRSGEAYWVWTQGYSDYQGPMVVTLDFLDGMDFGASARRGTITIRNLLDLNASVRLRLLASATPVPLDYRGFVGESPQRSWLALTDVVSLPAPAGQTLLVDLAPRRADLATDRAAQVLEIGNGLGSRRLLVVGASAVQSDATSGFSRSTDPHPFAGLWVGSASVRDVVEARCVLEPRTGCECLANNPEVPADPRDQFECRYDANGDGDPAETGCPAGRYCKCDPPTCIQTDAQADPTPTGQPFDLRLIVHVDAEGDATLLREVIELLKPPGTIPAPGDPSYQTVDPAHPAEMVLLTDDSRIHEFEGAVMRDGVAAGVRVATTAYDFDDQTPGYDAATRGMPVQVLGSFGPGAVATVTLTMRPDFPTHPFRHRYHPDRGADAPEIVRTMTLAFQSNWGTCEDSGAACDTDAQCAPDRCEGTFLGGLIPKPPGWGSQTIGGTYRETIAGLHRQPLTVQGTFLLSHAARATTINPPN